MSTPAPGPGRAAAPGPRATERLVEVGRGITLCCETLGDERATPVLLVQGLGQQLLSWHDGFCGELVAHDLAVVRFDNRDVGRSTRSPAPVPTFRQCLFRRFSPQQYDLGDMAADAAGLLDALGLESAHVVGISMGGMIAQTLAARHPTRVRSLVSIMSSTGGLWQGRTHPSLIRTLFSAPARTRDEAVARAVAFWRRIGSHGFPFDEEAVRAFAAAAYDRGHDPAGSARQLAAILKSGNRTREVRTIRAPTLVVHGDRDLLVHPSGGRATAAAIPGARHETIAGLGHDLPAGAWARLAELIASHVRAAER